MPLRLRLLFAALLFPLPALAAEPVDYQRQVKPLLAARCYACHGALKQKSGLRLDTVELMRKGGDSGPAIVPGDSGKSLLVDHVTPRNGAGRMPPESEGEPLKPTDVAILAAWIDQGATGIADEVPESDPKEHWAFKAPAKAAVPQGANPIDHFLALEWNKHGLTPQRAADKRILLRRVYLDLIGLPPTLDEQAAFLADTSSNAYAKAVDRLLASKQYGERWGRHWMDIWRYSDWWGLGADVRNSQKHIWHWRDWIIESLNKDKGYDQMLREMLASDELYPLEADKLRASGFLARQYFRFNRNTWLEETVEHTAKAFLGLTMNCTKCHDHKYDPISQEEFYRYRAIFEPYQVRMDMVPGQPDFEKDGIPRAFDCHLDEPTYVFTRGDEKQPRKDKAIEPAVPGVLAFQKLNVRALNLPLEAHAPGTRAEIVAAVLQDAKKRVADAHAAEKALWQEKPGGVAEVEQLGERLQLIIAINARVSAEANLTALEARAAADRGNFASPPTADAKDLAKKAAKAEAESALATAIESLARAELERLSTPADKKAAIDKRIAAAREAKAKAQQAAENPGEKYTPIRGALKTPESPTETEAQRTRPFPATSTGRRTAFAEWLTDRRNPLTARVAVNHIWARHFGKPLVATVFDFGLKGAKPTHPELLDYLAVDFMENGWSMKRLHRLIVTSYSYQMSSSAKTDSGSQSKDPENKYLWRMNPVRMEAQVIRDSLLHLSSELDLTMGGPPIPVANETSKRRSLYFVHSHNEHQKFLSTFDDANVLECYRRADSIVPQQALALENSKLVLNAALKISQRLAAKTDADFVTAAFELVLGSTPTVEERAECEKALSELKKAAGAAKDGAARARANLVHALLNHNDFVTIR